MRLDDLELVAVVVEAQSLTRAAAVLGVSKQTISRRLGVLERVLGFTIVHRTTRRAVATPEGAAFAQRCAAVVADAREAVRAVQDARATPAGLLRITADPVFGDAFVGPLVRDMLDDFPALRVDVTLTRRAVDLVAEGVDVAFRVGPPADPDLRGARLGPARVALVASPSYLTRHGAPAAVADLQRHACLTADHLAWPLLVDGVVTRVPIQPRLRTTSLGMALEACHGGLGVAMAPWFTVATDLAAGRLVQVLPQATPPAVGEVWVLFAGSRALSTNIRMCVARARARLRGF